MDGLARQGGLEEAVEVVKAKVRCRHSQSSTIRTARTRVESKYASGTIGSVSAQMASRVLRSRLSSDSRRHELQHQEARVVDLVDAENLRHVGVAQTRLAQAALTLQQRELLSPEQPLRARR